MKANTRILNGRLYAEGLKRLRVLGIGVFALVLIFSLLIPTVQWITNAESYFHALARDPSAEIKQSMVKNWVICVPALVFPFLSPIFLLVLFSYLLKRNESDFYHSIPYTRTCVYTSFLAAALTWIAAITTVSALGAGLVWAINPFASFLFSDLIILILISLALSVYLCGFMMLAIALCGNLTTVLLNFLLFALLPRAVAVMMGTVIDNNLFIVRIENVLGGFFTLEWWLPAQLLNYEKNIYQDLPTVAAISAVFGALLLAVSCYLYHKRPSQMAGNAAQGPKAQHWLRCIFTLPFALALTTYILSCESGYVDFVTVLVLIVFTLIAYYLYELITTKSFKCLSRATPWLGVVLLGCLLFTGSCFSIEGSFIYPAIQTEDIQSVSFGQYSHHLQIPVEYDSYERLEFGKIRFEDEEIRNTVAQGYRNAQNRERQLKKEDRSGNQIEVNITLKSGRTVTRTILLSKAEFEALRERILYDEASQKAFYTLPPDEAIEQTYLDAEYVAMPKGEDLQVFLEIFRREYTAASTEVKNRVLQIDDWDTRKDDNSYVLHIYSYSDHQRGIDYFHSRYQITSLLPESYAYLREYARNNPQTYDDFYDKDDVILE